MELKIHTEHNKQKNNPRPPQHNIKSSSLTPIIFNFFFVVIEPINFRQTMEHKIKNLIRSLRKINNDEHKKA